MLILTSHTIETFRDMIYIARRWTDHESRVDLARTSETVPPIDKDYSDSVNNIESTVGDRYNVSTFINNE